MATTIVEVEQLAPGLQAEATRAQAQVLASLSQRERESEPDPGFDAAATLAWERS